MNLKKTIFIFIVAIGFLLYKTDRIYADVIGQGYTCILYGTPQHDSHHTKDGIFFDAYHENIPGDSENIRICATIQNRGSENVRITHQNSNYCPDRGLQPYCNIQSFNQYCIPNWNTA